MAAPRLRLRRGTANPQTLTDAGETFALNPALVGEPFFADTDGTVPTTAGTGTGDFYIADGGTAFVHIGGSSYTARTDEFLTAAVPGSGTGAGGEVTFTEGGTNSPETVVIKAADDDGMTGSYTMILPLAAPTVAGDYLLEYDQASGQLSFVTSGAGEQLLTQQAPEDIDGDPDEYYLTFVDSNNTAGSPELETFYTEANLILQPDKDGNAGGSISSLQITGEYVASTGYFSGTGSTDTASVTTNFATEPTASGNTKAVNVGTGAASGSTTNVNIGSSEGGTTTINSGTVVGALSTQNVFNTVAQTVNAFGAATNIDIGAASGTMSINNALVDLDGDLNVDGADITTNVTGAFNLLNTNATTVNAFGAATTVEIGNAANTSVTNINGTTPNTLGALDGALVVDGGASVAGNVTINGDLAVEGGDIVADPDNLNNAASLYDTSTGTVNIAGDSTTLNLGNDSADATTVNIATGATATGTTKTVNIATNGDTDSTTNVNIGSVTEPDQTTVTINGNLTVTGAQTVTNIQTTNTNITDALITLNDGADANANNSNDIGLFLERGNTEENIFVGYDESSLTDNFVIAFTSSANTATGNLEFQEALVGSDTAGNETPLDFLPIQVGALRISDSTSRRGDALVGAGTLVDDVVIGHLTATEADTEFSVTDGIAGRHVYNVVIDGGSY